MPPSTRSVRVHTAELLEAMALTGLEEGPAARLLLSEGIAARKQPVTLEDRARAAHAAIERLREAVERLAATRGSPTPPPDMPPAPNGATMAVEAQE